MPISGAEDDQLDDARLGQRVVLAQLGRQRDAARSGRGEGLRHLHDDSMKPAPRPRATRRRSRRPRSGALRTSEDGQHDDQRGGAGRCGRRRATSGQPSRTLPSPLAVCQTQRARASAARPSARRSPPCACSRQARSDQRRQHDERRRGDAPCGSRSAPGTAGSRRRRRCRAAAHGEGRRRCPCRATTTPWQVGKSRQASTA